MRGSSQQILKGSMARHCKIFIQIKDCFIEIDCSQPEVASRIKETLKSTTHEKPDPKQNYHKITFYEKNHSGLSESIHSVLNTEKPILKYEHLLTYRKGNLSAYVDGFSSILVDRKEKTISGFIHEKTLQREYFFEQTFFLFALWELLSLEDIYFLHAGCLQSPENKNVLFPGNSQSGKTSLCLSLIRKGWKFLGDDQVFISSRGNVTSIPRDFHVDPQLSEVFPELEFLKKESPYFSFNPKRKLSPESLTKIYPTKMLTQLPEIHAIIFPQIRPIDTSALRPISKSAALVQMIPPSLFVLIGDNTAKRQLDCMKSYVERAKCYDLALGLDAKTNDNVLPNLLVSY